MVLRPFLVIKRITELSPEWLHVKKIKGLLLDIDNTITPYHSDEIPDDILVWLKSIYSGGIRFVPYSNARLYRIRNFCRKFDMENPGIAFKPLNLGLGRVLKMLGIPRDNLLLVGDQVFTDCLAGKFARIRTVLVDPVSKAEFPATRFMRLIERITGRHGWKYDRIESND